MKNPLKRRGRLAPRLRKARVGDRLAAAWSAVRGLAACAWQRLSGELRRRAFAARLREGDVILASPRTARLFPVALVYRLLLGARYVHSMLYLGEGRILHTTWRSGVVVGRLPRKVHRRDRYTVLRVGGLSAERRRRVVEEALRFEGRRLDRAGLVTNVPARLIGLRAPLLRLEESGLWCSRLIHRAYAANGVDLLPGADAETITSEDLRRSPVLEPV